MISNRDISFSSGLFSGAMSVFGGFLLASDFQALQGPMQLASDSAITAARRICSAKDMVFGDRLNGRALTNPVGWKEKQLSGRPKWLYENLEVSNKNNKNRFLEKKNFDQSYISYSILIS